MMFVTGGAGFIGANFVLDCLTKNNDAIVNIDNLTYAGNLNNLSSLESDPRHVFIRGDICDSALMTRLLAQYRPRVVIHFAAESHVDRSIHAPEAFIQTNIVGTFRLLEVVRSYWSALMSEEKSAFRFLHVSTDEVYGSLEPSAPSFTELHRYVPSSPYAASKAASDHLVHAYHHTYGIPAIITHCSNNYGPYQFPEKLIPLIISYALAGKDLPIYGDGQQSRDWLYVKDHARAIQRVLEAGKVGEVYNIGSGNEKTNIDIVYTICALLDDLQPRADGKGYHQQIVHVVDRLGHDRRYAVDTSKIRRDLGWRPLETFETGIRKTVQWYLDNPRWITDIQTGAYRDRQYADPNVVVNI